MEGEYEQYGAGRAAGGETNDNDTIGASSSGFGVVEGGSHVGMSGIFAVFAIILGIILWTRPEPVEKVAAPQPAAPAVAEAPAAPAPEITVQTQQWGDSVIFPIEGRDAARKRAAFDVAVLPTDLSWARRSSTVAHGDVTSRNRDG